MVQKRHSVLWAKAHLKLTVSKWKCVLWSEESKFDILVGNPVAVSSGLKRRETFQHYISVQFKSQHLWWYGWCISAYGMDSLHVLEGTMNAERYIHQGFRATYAPSRQCLFQQENAEPHTAAITTACLHSRRVWVLNWSACSPDFTYRVHLVHH